MTAPTGTVTIVFTDIEDSTRLWERHGGDFEACLKRHNEIMREHIAANSGFEVKTEGDAFMVAFARAGDAVQFALNAQLALDSEAWNEAVGKILVRMGMHSGEPIVGKDPDGRTDYFGPVVNRAARVAGAGHGGQILMSEATRSAAVDALGAAIISDLGEHLLKGLERPERLHQLLPSSMADLSFAPLQTATAQQTNLPAQGSTFIGRAREVEELTAMLAPRAGESSPQTKLLKHAQLEQDQRPGVITLVGPGGTGKTRLALRVGSEVLDRYDGGVWFADLSACREAGEAAGEVATALGVRLTGKDDARDAVGNVLQYRKPLLLILDNFEQLASDSDNLIGEWRRRAPQVTFLVTTRAVLGLEGEREFELSPMAAPDDPELPLDDLLKFESVALFITRAQEADKRFKFDDKNAADVARICADLEGIPLAVELAASRVKLMKPAQIVKRLEKKFELLKSTRRDTGMRQRTLYDALEWSFDLLNEWERSAFLQSCIFQDGFLLEAAEQVVDLSAFDDAPDVLDALQSLREKSLLRTLEGEFETRFGMYKPIHDFGENRLRKFSDLEGLGQRHTQHYVGYAELWAESIHTPEELEALDRLDDERANLYAAFDRVEKAGDNDAVARLALSVSELLMTRGPVSVRERMLAKGVAAAEGDAERQTRLLIAESRSFYEVSNLELVIKSAEKAVELAAGGKAGLRASAHLQLSHAYWLVARFDEADAQAATALALAEEDGGALLRSQALASMGIMGFPRGRYAEGVEYFQQAQELALEIGDVSGGANHLSNLGLMLGRLGRREEALETYARARDVFKRLGGRTGYARMIANAGAQYQMLGDLDKAKDCYEKAIAINRETGHKHGLATSLGNMGMLYSQRLHRPEDARPYLEEALKTSLEINAPLLIADHYGQWAHWHDTMDDSANALKYWRLAIKYNRIVKIQVEKMVPDLCHLGHFECFCGDKDAGFAAFAEARALAANPGQFRTVNGGEGRARYLHGEIEKAEEMLRLAVEEFEKGEHDDYGNEAYYAVTLAELLEQRGELEGARKQAHRVIEFHEAGKLWLNKGINEALEAARRIVGSS
ncbi:MAG: tetratricopeptide repeat protein [Planctomycetes bacterium]|nr:tetratricopeptide repeat protein [Planctomycetota bacterium]